MIKILQARGASEQLSTSSGRYLLGGAITCLLGSILFLQPAVTAAAAPAQVDGATIYRQRCQTCHTVSAKPSTLAPKLNGVVGRKAASAVFPYSAALKKSGIIWTRPALDKFLASPSKAVPGTRMVVGVPDAAQRKAVIDYLATLR